MNDEYQIQACLVTSKVGSIMSLRAFFGRSYGYGFWRLVKVNPLSEKQPDVHYETVEIFHGRLIDKTDHFVNNPSKIPFAYKSWRLCCQELSDNINKADKIISMTLPGDIRAEDVWDNAKSKLDLINNALQEAVYFSLGLLKRDSIITHNAVFGILGNMMFSPQNIGDFQIPRSWGINLPGIDRGLALLSQNSFDEAAATSKNPAFTDPSPENDKHPLL